MRNGFKTPKWRPPIPIAVAHTALLFPWACPIRIALKGHQAYSRKSLQISHLYGKSLWPTLQRVIIDPVCSLRHLVNRRMSFSQGWPVGKNVFIATGDFLVAILRLATGREWHENWFVMSIRRIDQLSGSTLTYCSHCSFVCSHISLCNKFIITVIFVVFLYVLPSN